MHPGGSLGAAGAALFEQCAQGATGGADVLIEEQAGGIHVAGPGELEQALVLGDGALASLGQEQLQAGVAFAVVIDVAQQGVELGHVGAGIEGGVELVVEATPGADVAGVVEVAAETLVQAFGHGELGGGEIGDGGAEDFGFQQGADAEELFDFAGGEGGDHGAAIGINVNQSLGEEFAEGLAHRDTADLEFGGNRILPQLFALMQLA